MPFNGMVRRYLIIYNINLLLLTKVASSAVQQIVRLVLHTTPQIYWQLLPMFPACSDSNLAAHWHVPEKGV